MKNTTKMWICFGFLFIFNFMYELLIDTKHNWIVAGILLFAFTSGWYGGKVDKK